MPKRLTFTWCASIFFTKTSSFFIMSSSRPGHCFQYVSRPTLTTPTFAASGFRRATRGPSANTDTAVRTAQTTRTSLLIACSLLKSRGPF